MSESITPLNELPNSLKKANELAVRYLAQGQFDSCFDVLKKTEYSLLLHTESILKQNLKSNENLNFLSITLNNLGCYFVCKNKIVAALKYFKKSKEIELFSVDREMEKAIANLNMSIVYLRMKNYKKSLEFAQIAENLLNTRILGTKEKPMVTSDVKALVSENSELISYDQSSLSIICIYYIGLNYEMLEMMSDAYLTFLKGYKFLIKFQDSNNVWEDKFYKKLTSIKSKLKDTIPYLEEITQRKTFPIPKVRKAETDESRISSLNDTDTKPRKIMTIAIKPTNELILNSNSLPNSKAKKPILVENLRLSNLIVEEEESKEETNRDVSLKKTIILPEINKVPGRMSKSHAHNVVRYKRLQGNEAYQKNNTAIDPSISLITPGASNYVQKVSASYMQKPTNQSFEVYNELTNNFIKVPPQLADRNKTPSLLTENMMMAERPRARSSHRRNHSAKTIKLTPLHTINRSERNSPAPSTMSSLELTKKTDLGFLVVLATKMAKRLTLISEKFDSMGTLNEKIKEKLKEFEVEDDDLLY